MVHECSKIKNESLSVCFFNSNCYFDQLNSLKGTAIYSDVKSQALDSLQSWVNSKIIASGIPPLRKRIEWRIDDAVFFNSKKTRVIFMILERDTALIQKQIIYSFI